LDKRQFEKLSESNFKRIPVWRTVLADLDTPLSVYLKLADGPDSYLFESVEGGETWGRYSIIGLPCKRRYTVTGNTIATHDFGEQRSVEEAVDPLARIEEIRSEFSSPELDELPLFTGGLVGYFGYETVGLIEPGIGVHEKIDELGTADIVLLQSEEVAVFDNLEGRLWLIINVDPEDTDAWSRSQRRLDKLEHRLRSGSTGYGLAVKGEAIKEDDFHYGFERDEFIAAVNQSKEYILAGDIFQVVLSQRMSVPFKARPIDVYRAFAGIESLALYVFY